MVRRFCTRIGMKSKHRLASTSAQVCKQLIEEEVAAARLGDIAAHDISPSSFINTGLELEEYQYTLCFSCLMLFLRFITGRI
jgi:hypothetical protein